MPINIGMEGFLMNILFLGWLGTIIVLASRKI